MKKGQLFSVMPNLVLHAIIFVAILSIIFGLVGTLFSHPENADAENELKNLASVINAFIDSDRMNDTFYVVLDGKYFFLLNDKESREVHLEGFKEDLKGKISADIQLKGTCSGPCVCAYIFKSDNINKIGCQDVKKVVYSLNKEDIKSNWGSHITLSPNADGLLPLSVGVPYGSTEETGYMYLIKKTDKIITLTRQ